MKQNCQEKQVVNWIEKKHKKLTLPSSKTD